jgi:two-component system cell cycle sensor histidine kinase/response regulator CckA
MTVGKSEVGSVRGVTDERATNATRRHFEAVVQSAPDAVMALGLDASVTAWNRGAEILFGYSADEMIGTNVWAIEGAEPGEIASLIERVAGGETIRNHQAVRRHKSGAPVDVAVTYAPIRDEHDHVDAVSVIARDIGELKEAQADAERFAHRVSLVLNAVGEAIFMADLENRATFVNDSACRLLGWTRDELLGQEIHALIHYQRADGSPYPVEECPIAVSAAVGEESDGVRETFWQRDGSPLDVELTVRPVYDQGAMTGSAVVFRDIGARLQAERAADEAAERLRRSEQHFRAAFDSSLDAMLIVDDERRYVGCNEAACALLGVSREELLTMRTDDFVVERTEVRAWSAVEAEPQHRGALLLRRGDGGMIEVEGSPRANFVPGLHLDAMRDVTERNRTLRGLRLSQDMLEKTERMNAAGSFEIDRDADELRLSPGACHIFGLGPGPGPLSHDVMTAFIHPDDRELFAERVRDAVTHGAATADYRIINGDSGEIRRIHARTARDPSVAGGARFVGSVQDVTERWASERRFDESEERYRGLVDAANEGILALDADGWVILANRAMAAMLGTTPEILIRKHLADFGVDPERTRTEYLARRELSERFEVQLRRFDGEVIDVFLSTTPRYDADHNFVGGLAMVIDQTERKRAERDGARLAAQVHQMQKLETVGRLAGGVAHDFNNLLAVIINYAEFAAHQLEDHPARDDILEIAAAAERAAELTQQLLLFSRNEMVRLDVMSVNDVVNGMDRLLHRTVGEDIVLQTRLASDLPNVMADRGQLEQVLLNLAINARDAMPDGGQLVITTRKHRIAQGAGAMRLGAGRYAQISVTDTGDGMSPEVAEHAFEPFFTTKLKGVGTGLGLASIYGIVTAAGGSIEINSEPGKGTTVTIDLPAAHGGTASDSGELPNVSEVPTVLVVEDQLAVGRVAVRVLAEAGYHTLSADGPERAIELAAGHAGPIDVVVTDVVMPGVSGPALVERLGRLRPDAGIVFMSGHIERSEKLPPGASLVRKPFHAADLIAAVAAALANEVSA